MSDEEYDYFGWAKTGHLNLTLGLFFGAYCLFVLVLAVDARATGAIVVYAVLLLGALNVLVQGVQQLLVHRARRNA